MSEYSDLDSVYIADCVNTEPTIFRGCTSPELGWIVGISIVVWLPASFLLTGLLGALAMGAGIAAIGVLATVFVMSVVFQRVKRGRPDAYHLHLVRLNLSRLKIANTSLSNYVSFFQFPFICRTGDWDIGRRD